MDWPSRLLMLRHQLVAMPGSFPTSKGETKNLDFKKEKAESELIAFITTHITCLMNGSKDKELIKKTY